MSIPETVPWGNGDWILDAPAPRTSFANFAIQTHLVLWSCEAKKHRLWWAVALLTSVYVEYCQAILIASVQLPLRKRSTQWSGLTLAGLLNLLAIALKRARNVGREWNTHIERSGQSPGPNL